MTDREADAHHRTERPPTAVPPFHMIHPARLIAALALTIATGVVGAQDRWSILTKDGEERTVIADGLGERVVRWKGIDRLTRSTPTDRIVTLTTDLPRWPDADAFEAWSGPGAVMADLVDGQRLVGRLIPARTDDAIAVRLGPVTVRTIPLDRVARLVLSPALSDITAPRQSRTQDSITLRNDDRLTGFVVAIAHAQTAADDDTIDPDARDRLTIAIDTDAGLVTVGLDRVRTIELANPIAPMKGQRVDLRNGSIVAAARVYEGARDLRSVILEPADESDRPEALLPVAIRDIAALTPEPNRVVPLASIEPASVAPGAGSRWTPGPRIEPTLASTGGLSAVMLPGPMSVVWPLPPEASVFTAVLGRARDAGPWTHAVVDVVSIDAAGVRRTLLTRTVSTDTTPERLWIPLQAGARSLEVHVTEGDHGPAQDRITLEHAAILLR